MKVAAIVAAALAASLCCYWVSRAVRPRDLAVQFVVPDHYQGIFRLRIDPGAADVRPERDGVWVFRIPDSGILAIRRRFPFSEWHRVVAVFASGAPLAVAQASPSAPYSTEIRLHSSGSATRPGGTETLDFFVGTDAQLLEIAQAVEPPLGAIRR